MNRTLQRGWLMEGRAKRAPLAKGIAWGFLGGLSGTMVMDILLMGALLVFRQPVLMCFSIVGDTVSHFLAMHDRLMLTSDKDWAYNSSWEMLL